MNVVITPRMQGRKKVLMVEFVVITIFSVLEIITAFRMGRSINYLAICAAYCVVTSGLCALKKREKEEANK